MKDPLDDVTMDHVVAASREIEIQLGSMAGGIPVVLALRLARKEAAAALTALVVADPEDARGIRALQNDVNRFRDLVRWFCEVFHDGVRIDAEMSQAEQEQIRRTVIPGAETETSFFEQPVETGDDDDGPYRPE